MKRGARQRRRRTRALAALGALGAVLITIVLLMPGERSADPRPLDLRRPDSVASRAAPPADRDAPSGGGVEATTDSQDTAAGGRALDTSGEGDADADAEAHAGQAAAATAGDVTAEPSVPSTMAALQLWPDLEPVPPGDGARLAIVVDDAGNNLEELAPFYAFPGRLTFAVLPQLPHSAAAARGARAAGHAVILHTPMQALADVEPGPGAIAIGSPTERIWEILDRDFNSIEGADGANNHMGSAATAHPETVDAVMAYMASHGKFFLDSRTTAQTVVPQFAERYAVPFAERDVFIDHDVDLTAMRKALHGGLAVAREQGQAVLIGHAAVQELATMLHQLYPALTQLGYRFVGVDELVQTRVAGAGAGVGAGAGAGNAGPTLAATGADAPTTQPR